MRYRKKPVVIEAWQFKVFGTDDETQLHPAWLSMAIHEGRVWYQGGEQPYFTIATLEGDMRANVGDWIIQGVKGELYPCKPDIFAATYEPVA